jgi:hypothetical protein
MCWQRAGLLLLRDKCYTGEHIVVSTKATSVSPNTVAGAAVIHAELNSVSTMLHVVQTCCVTV